MIGSILWIQESARDRITSLDLPGAVIKALSSIRPQVLGDPIRDESPLTSTHTSRGMDGDSDVSKKKKKKKNDDPG